MGMATVEDTVHHLRTDTSRLDEDKSGRSCWVVTEPTAPFLISAASAGWHNLWGYSKDEIAGKSTAILNGPGHDAKAATGVAVDYFAQGTARARCRNTSRDGSVYSHDIELIKLEDGCLAISRNVTLVRPKASHAEWVRLAAHIHDTGCNRSIAAGAAARHSTAARLEVASILHSCASRSRVHAGGAP